MKKTLEILKALSDSNRLRIAMLLKERTMCVCEIFPILNISGATLSTHLKILKNSGIIDLRKEGRFIYYFMNDDKNITDIMNCIENNIEDKSVIDADRLKSLNFSKNQCM